MDSILGNKPFPHSLQSWASHWEKAPLLLLLSGVILLLHFGQGALSAAQNYIAIKVGLRGLRRVRQAVFACLQRLSLRFHQSSKSGDLIYRATWDTYLFQTLFQQGLITFVTALLSLVLMLVVMWQLNERLALIALGSVPLLLLAIKIFGQQMSERGGAAQKADSHVTSYVQETIAALPLIQSYAREADEEKRFTTCAAVAQEKRLSQHGWELLYWLAISGVFGLGTAAIVWLGSLQVLENQLTVGELLIFITYLAQLYEPLNQLSHVGVTLSSASAGTQRVFELLDAPQEVKDAPNAKPMVRRAAKGEDRGPKPLVLQGNITLDHVSFGYEKDQPVLRDISFELAAGTSAAIIGPSGVGKSTLLNLLPRFFDPTAGAVRLDGVDLRELRLADLRAQIALVLQEPILLSASLAENIAYGKPNATSAEIEAAARAANAAAFIEKLPRRYDTIVGEGATHLSVGEKQRINLARAFLKDAPILLLDEPTSALDGESEALITSSIFDLMRGRTTLIVAHRHETIRRVDKILLLEEGGLSKVGTPAELLRQTS